MYRSLASLNSNEKQALRVYFNQCLTKDENSQAAKRQAELKFNVIISKPSAYKWARENKNTDLSSKQETVFSNNMMKQLNETIPQLNKGKKRKSKHSSITSQPIYKRKINARDENIDEDHDDDIEMGSADIDAISLKETLPFPESNIIETGSNDCKQSSDNSEEEHAEVEVEIEVAAADDNNHDDESEDDNEDEDDDEVENEEDQNEDEEEVSIFRETDNVKNQQQELLLAGRVPDEQRMRAETERVEGNARILKAIRDAQSFRTTFFCQHFNEISPFLHSRVRKQLELQCKDDTKLSSPSLLSKLTQAPPNINTTRGTMKDYQITGMNWMRHLHSYGIGGILGDEMGLGKTLQIISFLASLHHEGIAKGPHLIVAPLSVLQTWVNEIKIWCPSLRVVKVIIFINSSFHHFFIFICCF